MLMTPLVITKSFHQQKKAISLWMDKSKYYLMNVQSVILWKQKGVSEYHQNLEGKM